MSTSSLAPRLSPVRVTRGTAAIIAAALVAIAIAVAALSSTSATTVSSHPQLATGPSSRLGVPAGYVRDPATHAFLKISGARVSSSVQSTTVPSASNAFSGHR